MRASQANPRSPGFQEVVFPERHSVYHSQQLHLALGHFCGCRARDILSTPLARPAL